ncbi:prepilin-type N-terminal cleavage/methylation domain-containing protein [Weissella confusa]
MAKRRGFTLAGTLVALMVFSMALSLLGGGCNEPKTTLSKQSKSAA